MIASFLHRFIFIRTRKTASTSTEIVLGACCGPKDIVVPIGVDDEKTRKDYGGSPRNFSSDPQLETRYLEALAAENWGEVKRLYREIMLHLRFHHHMPATELRTMLDKDFWDSALKFAVDRHPYEKAVSLAYWRSRNAPLEGAAFSTYLDEVIERAEFRNFDLYSEHGKPIVDKVLRYEELDTALPALASELGITLPEAMPRAKGQYRKNREQAHTLLTPTQRARIQTACAEEFTLLGYEP
jgi:hypothetical protein